MTGVVSALPRKWFTDANGNPLAGGWLTVYLAGTSTLANTWQDKTQVFLNTNPIQLDANGSALIWHEPAKSYKYLLQDTGFAVIPGYPIDNIPGVGDSGQGNWSERAYPADGASWVVNFGSPINAVLHIFINGRRQRLSDFTITLATGTIAANFVIQGSAEIDINWM